MSVLGGLFGGRAPRKRPDLTSWADTSGAVLFVDGTGPGLAPLAEVFDVTEQTMLRHETGGGPGVPFHDRDARRLPRPGANADGAYGLVVLAEVLDKVLDVGVALEAAFVVITGDDAHKRLVIVQAMAPDDYEERAAWNALARMRDPRHAWTPSSKQLTALYSGLSLKIEYDAVWDETADPLTTLRPETADKLAQMVDAVTARGLTHVIRDGAFVVSRRATIVGRR